jgi:hypothetical protein
VRRRSARKRWRTPISIPFPPTAHAHRWDRIRINGLNIGWTETEGEDLTQRLFHGAGDDWQEKAAKELPMGKLGQD